MTNFIVTSCGTDIGKTHAGCLLMQALKARGRTVRALKPLISGMQNMALADTDSGRLLVALGQEVTPDAVRAIAPWQFAAPLSPSMAARAEGVELRAEAVAQWCLAELRNHPQTITFIEGAGGVMAPLSDHHTMRDLFGMLNAPVILVVGCYLGSISHALTALAALKPLPVAAVIISDKGDTSVGREATQAELRRFIPNTVPIFSIPNGASASDDAITTIASHLETLC